VADVVVEMLMVELASGVGEDVSVNVQIQKSSIYFSLLLKNFNFQYN
jgi:hypothetical protein